MLILKKKVRDKLRVVFILLVIAMAVLVLLELLIPKYEMVKTNLFEADGEARISYDVNLIDNPIFDKKELPEGGYYLKPFTDYVDINCSLSVNSDEAADIVTQNSIDVSLVSQLGSDDEPEVIWEKKQEVAAPVTEQSSDGTIDLERNVKLYFEEYDALVNELIDEYDLYTDYYIKVTFNTTVVVTRGEVEKEEMLDAELIIPFYNSIYSFEGNNIVAKDITIEKLTNQKQAVNMNLVILYSSILLAMIVLLLLFVFKTKPLANEDSHSVQLSKIFKQYGNRLAGLGEPMTYQSSVMIGIDKIEDMVKIADEIGQTIFYYKVEDEIERKIEFYIFDEGRIYYLVIFGEL